MTCPRRVAVPATGVRAWLARAEPLLTGLAEALGAAVAATAAVAELTERAADPAEPGRALRAVVSGAAEVYVAAARVLGGDPVPDATADDAVRAALRHWIGVSDALTRAALDGDAWEVRRLGHALDSDVVAWTEATIALAAAAP
ncbi:MAG: hypothetical protein JWM48_1382 [Mycobacterium sp.]|nr:hypothetical protein [Mycobacterium sp.]